MGYILPLNHERNIQYVHIDTMKKHSPLKLTPVHHFTIQPIRNHLKAKGNSYMQQVKSNVKKKEELAAEITGLGRFVNKLI